MFNVDRLTSVACSKEMEGKVTEEKIRGKRKRYVAQLKEELGLS